MATTSAQAQANGKRTEQQEDVSRAQTIVGPVAGPIPANEDASTRTTWFGWVSENFLVEWPIVMAIGVGTVVVQQTNVSRPNSARCPERWDS